MLFIGLTAGCKMQNAECKIEVFPSEMNKIIYFVRIADTFILHFTSCILHFVVANNKLSHGDALATPPRNSGVATFIHA